MTVRLGFLQPFLRLILIFFKVWQSLILLGREFNITAALTEKEVESLLKVFCCLPYDGGGFITTLYCIVLYCSFQILGYT